MSSLFAVENLAQAIPEPGCEPLSANQLVHRSQRPRMQLREAEQFLSFLVRSGEVSCIEMGIGRYRYYVKTPKWRQP